MTYKIIIILFLFQSAMETLIKPQILSENWFFRQIPLENSQENNWYPAAVPGLIHLDLLANKLIPDPYYRDNEAKVQWIENYDWEYQTKFNVSSKLLLFPVIELRFEGLDTHASVYINEALILQANNFFRSWVVNVKDHLKPLDNILRIYFKSAVNYDNEMKAKFQPLIVPSDDPARTPFSRKPRYHYGWDWGPRLVTCGIHKPISLVGYEGTKIKNFNLETLEIKESNFLKNSAKIRVEAFIQKIDSEKLINYKLIWLENSEKKHLIDAGMIQQNNGSIINYEKVFQLDNVELWWSRGMGSAKLYDFLFEISDSLNETIDKSEKSFGIRTIKLMQTEDNDKNGAGFNIRINNRDIFIKGANYIPPDSFLTRVTPTKYDQIINDILGANYNAIRLWGGGYFESPYFYNKCDENGILILHDLMFACEMYAGTPEFMSNYQEEFSENILNLKTHASIALWIGNNEVDEAWHNWGFTTNLTEENIKTVWGWYLSIFKELLPNVISRYDSQRSYWPSSPLFGYYHSESLRFGDSHYWSVWAAGQPIENYRNNVGRFMSEYGMQGILDLNSIRLFTLPEDRNLNSSTMKMHEKHLKGFQNLNLYINETHGILPVDFEDYVYLSQIMQAYAIELAVVSHRGHKPYCMGTLYWQLNDAWPAISWASVDHYGHWKALHYSARRFNQDLILIGRENNGSGLIEIRVLSELKVEKRVDLEIHQYNMRGDVLDVIRMNDYVLKGLSNSIVKTFDVCEEIKNNVFFYLRVVEKEEKNVWENFYFMKEPKKLDLVKKSEIKIKYVKKEKGLRVWSKYFVKSLYIYCDEKYLRLDINYFDLRPKIKQFVKILNIDEIGEDLEGKIKFKSFNGILEKYGQTK